MRYAEQSKRCSHFERLKCMRKIDCETAKDKTLHLKLPHLWVEEDT